MVYLKFYEIWSKKQLLPTPTSSAHQRMHYRRMPIEVESPEEKGYANIRYNLAESSVRDRTWEELGVDLSGLVIGYGEHRGDRALREVIASESNYLSADDILVTAGAATALFVVATTLLSPQEHLVVIRPNYATNLETPRTIGCEMSVIDLHFDNDFSLDFQKVANSIRPNTTLISLTTPHNPTGKVFPEETIDEIIALAESIGCYVLVDETYRHLNFKSQVQPYAAEKSRNVISICSLSKAFGVPGIRTGWLICQDTHLMTDFLAAKEQIMIGNSVVDEAIALQLLKQRKNWIPPMHKQIRENFQIIQKWFAHQRYLEWHEPQAGVVCFPRLKQLYTLDAEAFHQDLYQKYQTVVGSGHWFEQEDKYFRIGFGFPTPEELKGGLANFEACLKAHLR